jgi:hypothetical protein
LTYETEILRQIRKRLVDVYGGTVALQTLPIRPTADELFAFYQNGVGGGYPLIAFNITDTVFEARDTMGTEFNANVNIDVHFARNPMQEITIDDGLRATKLQNGIASVIQSLVYDRAKDEPVYIYLNDVPFNLVLTASRIMFKTNEIDAYAATFQIQGLDYDFNELQEVGINEAV